MLIGSAHGPQREDTSGGDRLERVNSQIRNLQRQIKQVEKDSRLSKKEKEDKLKELREQISRLELQKAQAQQPKGKAAELDSSPARRAQNASQSQESKLRRGKYDFLEPAQDVQREDPLYSVTREEDGSLRITFHDQSGADKADEELLTNAEEAEEADEGDRLGAGEAKGSPLDNSPAAPSTVISETERHCFCEGNEHNRETGQDCYVQIVSMKTPDGKPVDSPEVGRKIPLNDLPD